MKGNEIVLAATYSSLQTAAIVQGMLENHGIKSIIDNALMSSIYPVSSAPFGQVRLMVRASDAEQVHKLLEEYGDEI